MAGLEPQNIDEVPKDLFFHLRDRKIVMHNAKFDLHVLERAGIPYNVDGIYPNLYDTMLMSHYINENTLNDLDTLSKYHTKVKKNVELAKKLKPIWETAPIPYMAKYAAEDAVATVQLFEYFWPEFSSLYIDTWEKVDRDFLFVLLDIEKKGIRIDFDECTHQEVLCLKRMEKVKSWAGWDINSTNLLQERLFGPPPVGYGLTPLSYTDKGKPQVNKNFLSKTNHPICGAISEYRDMQKLAGYFSKYRELAIATGYLHPTFKMHGTVTGRLSCENPNLQQIPRESDVKKMFLPDDGFELWEFDYRTLEARMAAVYTQASALLEVFRNGRDIHQEVADRLGISRQVAKIVNFLILYGGGAEALSYQAGISLKEARKIIADYKKAYPEVFNFIYQSTALATSQGFVRMFSGRRRHFKHPNEAHKAFNSLIQGGSFELVKRSMIACHKAGVDMRNQVHDSIWVNIRDEREKEEIERLMVEWTEEAFNLSFPVDSKRLN